FHPGEEVEFEIMPRGVSQEEKWHDHRESGHHYAQPRYREEVGHCAGAGVRNRRPLRLEVVSQVSRVSCEIFCQKVNVTVVSGVTARVPSPAEALRKQRRNIDSAILAPRAPA